MTWATTRTTYVVYLRDRREEHVFYRLDDAKQCAANHGPDIPVVTRVEYLPNRGIQRA